MRPAVAAYLDQQQAFAIHGAARHARAPPNRLLSHPVMRALALHHLVPAHAPVETWRRASTTFAGELLVPADGESITIGP